MGWKCEECGLDYDTVAPSDVGPAVRSYPRRFRALVAVPRDPDEDRPDDEHLDVIRRRPSPEVWSALEYTAHVRTVIDALAESIERIHVGDTPTVDPFAGRESDPAVDRGRDPEAVLVELEAAAERFGAAVDTVKGEEWNLAGVFPWGERDILATARNAVHEGSHHLRDAERVLRDVRSQPSG